MHKVVKWLSMQAAPRATTVALSLPRKGKAIVSAICTIGPPGLGKVRSIRKSNKQVENYRWRSNMAAARDVFLHYDTACRGALTERFI